MGIVLLKILRAEGDPTPFIVFTGRGREHVVVEALNNRPISSSRRDRTPRPSSPSSTG